MVFCWFFFESGFCTSHKLLMDAFVNSNFYHIHLSAVASKAALPCCTVPTREATTIMHLAIGKARKTHGNTGLLPLLMHPSVPLSRFCVLGVFCVSTHPQPRCCRALCSRAFSGMAFPLSSAQGQRQNALKPPAGGAAVFASLAVNSPNSLLSRSFGALPWMLPAAQGEARRWFDPRLMGFTARSFAFRAGGMGKKCKRAHPEGVQGRGKSRPCAGLGWTCSLGEGSGKPGPGRSCSRGSRIPRSPSSLLSADSDSLLHSRAQPRLHQGPVLVLQRAGTPGSPCEGTQGPRAGGAAAKKPPRGHSGSLQEAVQAARGDRAPALPKG